MSPAATCPHLPLTPTWEEFQKTLKKKVCREADHGAPVLEKRRHVWHRLADAETLDKRTWTISLSCISAA